MNSEERHEARYQRRKAEREKKRQNAGSKTFDEVFSYENLCEAGKECCRGVRWKTSTKDFEMRLLYEVERMRQQLQNGVWRFRGFRGFKVYERGKLRNIDAVHIYDRALQKCFCNNYLLPIFQRISIYDNGACVKGKGIGFAMKRLKRHLSEHYRRYGMQGGIYQFDFCSYFESIPHNRVKETAKKYMQDEKLYKLFCEIIDGFDKRKSTQVVKGFGVGLGSEVSQAVAMMYAGPIDHYVKDMCGIRGYARFSDDGYAISNSIEKLQEIQNGVHKIANELGLKINGKKDKITTFRNHGFRFLKARVRMYQGGGISVKINKKSVKSIRRRLKTFRGWVDCGKMQSEDAFSAYQSWRAYAKQNNSYNTLKAMDVYFIMLFKDELRKSNKRYKCCVKAVKTGNTWAYMRSRKAAA